MDISDLYQNIYFLYNAQPTMATYCFIVGSFAYTAPDLRDPKSDVDILASSDLSDDSIRKALFESFPNLPSTTHLDITRRGLVDGRVPFKIAYWQEDKYISLIDSPVTIAFTKTPPNIPNCLRDPNKQAFIDYMHTSHVLEFHRLSGLIKSIEHYGWPEFNLVIEHFIEKPLLLSVVEDAKKQPKSRDILSISRYVLTPL